MSPCQANDSTQAASTAASTIGSASPGQPAMTALIATFSTVASPPDRGAGPTAAVRRHRPPDLLRVTAGVLEHADDAFGRGRDHRQPVGQPAVVQRLED